MIELDKDLLLSVMKPARYIGGEVGAVKKDWVAGMLKVCLCFPDTYEIGMSHLGLRILYDLINRRPDSLAERAFAPWTDMDAKMREKNIPLFSLESRAPLRDFDIIGFSLQYELCATNVLSMLSLSGIPLRSSERREADPLVIAGGTCCLNPEPMADFIDAFCIGESEETLLELMDVVRTHRGSGRARLLTALGRIPGVYVPGIYLKSKDGAKIVKRVVADLESVLDIRTWVVPYIEIVHDRLGLEIMRGCPHRCRFCQARSCFYPLRLISKEKILATTRRLSRLTGYEEVSLLSLSTSDHPEIGAIAKELLGEFRPKGVGISLPSVRAKNIVGELSGLFAGGHKTSLTFAPEAGSDRLRQILQKDFNSEEFYDVAARAFEAGYRLLKLYFMIGLPTETNDDLDAIADLCLRVSRMRKEVAGHPAQLHVSVSNFVPKPHTHFQREAMATVASLQEKHEYLKNIFRKHRGLIQLKFHDPRLSFMEGLISRGDRSMSGVILRAYEAGARFDAWSSHFNCAIWDEALRQAGLDPTSILGAKAADEPLPWSFVDVGAPDL